MRMSILALLTIFLSTVHTGNAQRIPIHHPQHALHLFGGAKEVAPHGKLKVIDLTYIITLSVGGQPVYLVFDTGSHFIWVEHEDCKICLVEQDPPRGRYKDSLYTGYMICNSIEECNYRDFTPGATCTENRCKYQLGYPDHSGSDGDVGIDVFSLFDDAGKSVTMVFGVGNSANTCNPFKPASCFQGVAGFGTGSLALPAQLYPVASRWGFCLPPDPSMDGSFLVGDAAVIQGEFKRAPIYDIDYVYQTNLTDVFVGTTKLTAKTQNPMILLDTGTTLSYLDDNIFDNLVARVRTLVTANYQAAPVLSPDPGTLELCYDQPYQVQVTLQLTEVSFVIDDPNVVWYNSTSDFPNFPPSYCLTFARNFGADENILGNFHLRGHVIIYDVTDPITSHIEISTSRQGEGCLAPN